MVLSQLREGRGELSAQLVTTHIPPNSERLEEELTG